MNRPKNEIILGDVLEKSEEIRSLGFKFDVVIADPPYNSCHFNVTGIAEYKEWCNRWVNLCLDMLNKEGVLYLYGFSEILAHISVLFDLNSQKWLVWHYSNKNTPRSTFWQRSHESILCLWRSDKAKPRLYIDQIRVPYTENYKKLAGKRRAGTPSRFNNFSNDGGTVYNVNPFGASPRDVITVPALSGGAGKEERWFMCYDCDRNIYPAAKIKEHNKHNILKHPTQKPFKLTKQLFLSRVKENDGDVFIPFAGSGSECLLAEKMGLSWIGIEINSDYIEFANKWIKEYLE